MKKSGLATGLTIEEHIDGACLGVKIPVMLLQPLYENAVKHGVYESAEKVRIITTASVSDGFLELTISNNFEPGTSSVKGTSTGLLNVSRRLELTYGKNASMKTEKLNGIFTVKIYIPTENSEMS